MQTTPLFDSRPSCRAGAPGVILSLSVLLAACATPAPDKPPTTLPTAPIEEPVEEPVAATPIPATDDPFELLQTPIENRGPGDLVLVAVGDVAQPARQWPGVTEALGDTVFDPTRQLLASGDLVFMNLETPITDRPTVAGKRFAYTTPPERLNWYLDAGFNMVSLANNHIADAGEAGIEDTIENIEAGARRHGLTVHHAGAGRSVSERYQPVRIALPDRTLTIAFFAVGFSDSHSVVHWRDPRLLEAIEGSAGDDSVDLVVVSAHAGVEYQHWPAETVRQTYRQYVDAGADLVLGHHPHVIQPLEHHRDSLIVYSLGNFVFASRTQRHHTTNARLYGMMTRVVIRDTRVRGVEIVPLWVNNSEAWTLSDGSFLPRSDFTPQILEGEFADQFFRDLEVWSRKAGATVPERVGDRARIRLD